MPTEKLKVSMNILKQRLKEEQQSTDSDWDLFLAFADFIAQFITSEMSEEEQREWRMRFDPQSSFEKMLEFILNEQHTAVKIITALVDELLTECGAKHKCAVKAKEARECGNQYFRNKQYEEALKHYSDAVALSPFVAFDSSSHDQSDESELSLALANRSAALFHLKRFRESLNDINKAVIFGYPFNRCHLLFARKILVLKALGTEDNEANKIVDEQMNEYINKRKSLPLNEIQHMQDLLRKTLKQNSVRNQCEKTSQQQQQQQQQKQLDTKVIEVNKFFANASSAVEVKQSVEKGRYVQAKRDICASEVLFDEKPFAHWLRPAFYKDFCSHCMKYLNNFHYPCKNCSTARYCSDECLNESWQHYHSYECAYLDALHYLSIGHLALRLLLKVGIENALKEAKFVRDKVEDATTSYNADYTSVLSLLDHRKSRSAQSLRSYAVGAAFIAFMSQKMNIIEYTSSEFIDFAALIFKHILQILCNTSSILFDELELQIGHQTIGPHLKIIGAAIYPSIAMLNHSCDTCVYPLFRGSEMIIKATNNVKAGEEITFNYGYHYRKISFKDRQQALKSQYYFTCECKLCEQRMENIEHAFRCPNCINGALIMNSDDSNYCTECGKSIGNVGLLRSSFAHCMLEISNAYQLFEIESNEAKDTLLKCLHRLNELVFSKHELLLEIHERLAKCYEREENYKQALKHWSHFYKICTAIRGSDDSNYDILNCLLNLSMLLLEEGKKSKNVKRMFECAEKARKYFNRAVLISDQLKGKEYQVLSSVETVTKSIELMPLVKSELSDIFGG
ncbi:SET and MYND domain-containing protein (SMYD)-like protein [Dinothrombium tinctorium]|uniref:Protein-lysine N-methyltransferase SMYD4 n=1 Tax=Dinothrombium tinctorium TaxID=1965070 RepID=A0A3S3NUL1_9ACAR|nr:SET and MYND domain-containing protein (SMYD)-like protein [Dinothrombium tinctorium]RWS05409.1 SET and MYND domain-containing protein (SMYD)-like protein [Dinothrombium tinctorium]RWS09480.1 SET and MYND domain-containing protein (SMYD)-like protein [Dinothrombium tinctorium]